MGRILLAIAAFVGVLAITLALAESGPGFDDRSATGTASNQTR